MAEDMILLLVVPLVASSLFGLLARRVTGDAEERLEDTFQLT